MKLNMNIFLMGVPHHANIGDLAIAYSEEKMIKELFPNNKLYIMQEEKLDICAKKVKSFVNDDDIILLHGGGNIGDTYIMPEKVEEQSFQLFPIIKLLFSLKQLFLKMQGHSIFLKKYIMRINIWFNCKRKDVVSIYEKNLAVQKFI